MSIQRAFQVSSLQRRKALIRCGVHTIESLHVGLKGEVVLLSNRYQNHAGFDTERVKNSSSIPIGAAPGFTRETSAFGSVTPLSSGPDAITDNAPTDSRKHTGKIRFMRWSLTRISEQPPHLRNRRFIPHGVS